MYQLAHQSPDDLAAKYPGFHSFKTSWPVRYRHRWFRDALIRSTLSPAVDEVAPAPAYESQVADERGFEYIERSGSLTFVVSVTSSGSDALRYRPDRTRTKLVLREDLRREPQATAERGIWRHKRTFVDPVSRYRLLDFLGGRDNAFCVRDVVETIGVSATDAVAQVLSMIANGSLELIEDLGRGLGPKTPVKLGRMETKLVPHQLSVTRSIEKPFRS